MKILFMLSLLVLSGCAFWFPSIHEMQAGKCKNESYPEEWVCLKSAMKNGPRHRDNFVWLKEIKQIYVFGDQLEGKVKEGLMPDIAASARLSEYVDEITRDKKLKLFYSTSPWSPITEYQGTP